VRVDLDGESREVWAVDLPDGPDPETVAAAVRAGALGWPDAGPVHAHVGCLSPDCRIERRPALVAVARSQGTDAPEDERIRAVRASLATLEAPDIDLRPERERVATTGAERERLRERVATLQGRVRALREVGADASEAEADLREAVRAFSEAETERAAAEQALASKREQARDVRDVRDRRLRLEDRRDNLERAARKRLARAVRPEVEAALGALPGTISRQSDLAFGLACARVASLRAPVVLADGPFRSAERAADWLDSPVLCL
jgi:hypothetical protein